ncbi:Tetratricopeptide repeat (TPR)-like superfamily protein [Euphorbia peplus]|nr:Tetratricopeptide repeat (TPR)-like superfamily protein [Euphorbia peplus]
MLLRSTSTPILQTLLCPSSTIDLDPTRPVSMSLQRTSSEGELRLFGNALAEKKLNKSCGGSARSSPVVRESQRMSFCVTAAAEALAEVDEEEVEEVSNGGDFFGGGSDGGDGWWGSSGYNGPSGNQQMDEYYERMIKLYPGDALLLANYAKFLKEIRGDNMKAEEVCERAILANQDDGDVLSMYGDLIWKNHKDGDRANTYFDQAVQSSPHDCYVLASYARFLWDADDEDKEKEAEDSEDEEFEFPRNDTLGYPPLIAAT